MIEKTAIPGLEAPVPSPVSLPAQLPTPAPPPTHLPLQPQSRQIKLINAIDEALIRRELLSPKSLRACEVEAWPAPDQTYLLLPPLVVKQLGLRLVDQRTIRLADGHEELVNVTEAVRIEWNGKQAAEDALVLGERVVLSGGLLKKLASAEAAGSELAAPELANRASLEDDPWLEQPTTQMASVAASLSATNGTA